MDSVNYSDLYDRMTVDECRRYTRHCEEQAEKMDGTNPENEIKRQWSKVVLEIILHCVAGERAINKQEAIQKWIERDRRLQDFQDKVQPPKGVRCLRCSIEMSFTSKSLYETELGREQVLFFYARPSRCKPNRAFFDDGKEYPSPTTVKNVEVDCTPYTRLNFHET